MATQYTGGLVAGQILTAATMNSIGAAWESYTPTIKGGATTVTATFTYSKYAQINKTVFVEIAATVTSAGAANGIIVITLPTGLNCVSPVDFRSVGTFVIKDSGTAYYTGAAIAVSGTEISGLAYGSNNNMGANSPAFTLANGDALSISICYEIA